MAKYELGEKCHGCKGEYAMRFETPCISCFGGSEYWPIGGYKFTEAHNGIQTTVSDKSKQG